MDIKKAFATDKEKEKNGVWLDVGPNCKTLIARVGNPNYLREFKRLTKVHTQSIRRGIMEEEVADAILIKVMAKTILLDWEGMEEDGEPIPYSVDAAIRLLTMYKDFRDLISEISNTMDAYKVEVEEDSEKNSQSS